MSTWKPKVWRVNGLWLCSYYRNSPSTAAAGRTPIKAYESWKWKEYQKYLPLGAAARTARYAAVTQRRNEGENHGKDT